MVTHTTIREQQERVHSIHLSDSVGNLSRAKAWVAG
jgi:hypothetical protein